MSLRPGRLRSAAVDRDVLMKTFAVLSILVAIFSSRRASAADPRPIDRLLRIAPENSVCVVTVEDLREQARRFAGSKLATALWRLPPARAWLDTEGHRRFDRARDRIETILGSRIEEIRDEILGDAAALALRISDQGAGPQGLLFVQSRNKALLSRVLERLDQSQKETGELDRILEKRRGGVVYHGRVYAAADRPSDWYVTTSDGIFAFSSDESMVTSAIDRWIAITTPGSSRAASVGFGDSARLTALKGKMPAGAVARLYLDPRRLERLIPSGEDSTKPAERRVLCLIARSLAAVQWIGATLEWDDTAITLRVCETLDAAKVAPWLKRWAADERVPSPRVDRVPAAAIIAASINLDAKALYDGFVELLSPTERIPLDHVETVLTGLLLGTDVSTRILPGLGPRVVVFLKAPVVSARDGASEEGFEFPMGLMIGLDAPREKGMIGHALENALKTVLALASMDEKRGLGGSRIVTSERDGARVTAFDRRALFAFAVDQDGSRLVVGSSGSVVDDCLGLDRTAEVGSRFQKLASVGGSRSPSFVVIDLQATARAVEGRRRMLSRFLAERQGRSVEAVEGDLTKVLALARELEAVVVTHAIEPAAGSAEQGFRLVLANPPIVPAP